MRLQFHLIVGALVVVFVSLLPAFAQAQSTPEVPPNASVPQSTPDSGPQTTVPPTSQEQTAPKEEGTQGADKVATPPPPASSKQQASEKKPVAKPKSQIPRRKGKKRVATTAKTPQVGAGTATSQTQPGKVVVRNGGASEALIQLSPGGAQEQEAHRRENTEQLLATTDENLKRIATRQLTAAEQGTVDQIRSYVRQAKAAADAGDLSRAHTLAFKAHLLSDDLGKH